MENIAVQCLLTIVFTKIKSSNNFYENRILKKKMNKGQTQRTWRIKTLTQTIFLFIERSTTKKKGYPCVFFRLAWVASGICYLARREKVLAQELRSRPENGEDTFPWKHKDKQSLPVAFSLVEMTNKAGQCCNKERYCAHPYPQDSIRIDQGVDFLQC